MAKILPHLEMHQVYGKIAINQQNAKQDIRQPKAEQTIRQPQAEMKVERRPASVSIDQTEAWHNLDLKSAFTRIADATQTAKQDLLEGIARHAQQGDELLHLERHHGSNLIAEQAGENAALAVVGTHYDTGSTPAYQSVKYNVDPGALNISWESHAPDIEVTTHAPEVAYVPGGVNVSMQQYPSLTIEAVGIFVDEKG